MLSVELHLSGSPVFSVLPPPLHPRNRGQSAAPATNNSTAIHVTRQKQSIMTVPFSASLSAFLPVAFHFHFGNSSCVITNS
jgi:hypothetical protein